MKGVTKGNIKKYALNEFLTEYKELNTDNKYRPVAVGRYGIRKRESIYSKELAKDYSKNKLIHKGTLTVGMGSKQIDIGILIEDEIFAVSPAYHTYEIQGIRCKYLEYCLRSKNIEMFSLYAKRGSRQGKSIDLKRWLTYKIPVYSEKDQIVIEENLNKINYVIELRRKQIDLLDELVKARSVEMFGDPRINDKKWKAGKIVDYFEVKGGKRIPKGMGYAERKTNHPYLRASDMKNATILDDDIHYIDEEVYKRIKRYTVNAHDIYLTNVGVNLGMAGVIPKKYDGANLTENAVKLVPKDKILLNGMFLSYYINSPGIQHYINERKMSVGVPKLAIFRIESMPLLLPPLELQNQFASFVEEVDKSRLLSNHSLFLIKSLIF